MNLIDVHMIFTPGFDSESDRDRMMAQLADEPVNVHLIEGADNVSEARIRGYRSGEAPFVTYVDPDDAIQKGAFCKLAEAIAAFPACCYFGANEYISTPVSCTFTPFRLGHPTLNVMHHLQVMRRDVVGDSAQKAGAAGWYALGQEHLRYVDVVEKSGRIVYLDMPLYDWRRTNPLSVSKRTGAIVDFAALQRRLIEANPLVTLLGDDDFIGDRLVGRGVDFLLADARSKR